MGKEMNIYAQRGREKENEGREKRKWNKEIRVLRSEG
jgi:hypothetical protein